MTRNVKWLDEPEPHDYPAAFSYLLLGYYGPRSIEFLVEALRAAPVMHFAAKDILRASGLTPLDASNRHVAHNIEKAHDGKPLSPVLLVRDNRLLIADGFHRVCGVHLIDEDAPVPCKLV